jgi:hypothetical protein
VVLNEAGSQALFLQPPAELVFRVPVSEPGILSTAIAIHPEAWNKANAGGCEFQIRVDGRLALAAAIDPIHLAGDRCWHELKLNIPQSPTNHHEVIFETRSIGNSADFRWALWRAPKFSWRGKEEAETRRREDAERKAPEQPFGSLERPFAPSAQKRKAEEPALCGKADSRH